MKLLNWVMLALPLQLFAQTDDTKTTLPTEKKRTTSIGLVYESNASSAVNGVPFMNTVGLQYKKNYKRNTSYQAILGYGHYEQTPGNVFRSIKGDTALSRSLNSNINLAMAGFGLETERRFYKRVFFFAGIEGRIGYGSGHGDTLETRYYNRLQPTPINGSANEYVNHTDRHIMGDKQSMLYAALTPYAGAKLDIKRITFGLTLMNSITFTGITTNGYSQAMMDINLGNIPKRFFILYKL